MAIVNSIILGRAKGSLGNVTLATVKGRVIAKQKATIVSNPNTEKQQEQRGKLAKVVLAWQLVGNFVKSGITSKLPFSSEYNTYCSKNIDIFASKDVQGNEIKGKDLEGSFATLGKLPSIGLALVAKDDDSVNVSISAEQLKNTAKVGDTLKILVVAKNSGKTLYKEIQLEENHLNTAGVNTELSELGFPYTEGGVYALWLETADKLNSTVSKFVNV